MSAVDECWSRQAKTASCHVKPTTKNTSHDTTVALPPDAVAVAEHADLDQVMDMHSKSGVVGAPCRWTPEEDVKLTSALTQE